MIHSNKKGRRKRKALQNKIAQNTLQQLIKWHSLKNHVVDVAFKGINSVETIGGSA